MTVFASKVAESRPNRPSKNCTANEAVDDDCRQCSAGVNVDQVDLTEQLATEIDSWFPVKMDGKSSAGGCAGNQSVIRQWTMTK